MESALQASGTLGVMGALAKPASRTRRKQSSGALTSEGISSRNRSIGSQVAVGVRSSSSEYAQGATVEALRDVELVELVLPRAE